MITQTFNRSFVFKVLFYFIHSFSFSFFLWTMKVSYYATSRDENNEIVLKVGINFPMVSSRCQMSKLLF